MRDAHLEQVRRAKSLRVMGNSWSETAKALGLTVSTARNRVAEYEERRRNGTLFTDIDSTMGRDVWEVPSLPKREAVPR